MCHLLLLGLLPASSLIGGAWNMDPYSEMAYSVYVVVLD